MGLEAQARQDSHRDALERLRSLTESAPNSDRDQVRAAATAILEARRKQRVATTQARDIAQAASSVIATQVDEFNSDYIDPLDRLMKRINRAILCDKRVGIDLHVAKRKIAQSASQTDDVPAGIDPLLVHSEGQLAALAVSMLSAASLTYPWSSWRAMVLDDPLQHNDAIHAAAFADLIGSMVQRKAYQIFLSTHDLAQAEFLQRKFDARNIPCATLTLLGRGEDGVRWDFRPARGDHLKPAANA